MRYNLILNFPRNMMTSPFLNFKLHLFCLRVRSQYMLSLAYVVVVLLLASNVAEAAIGINWGRHTTQRLLPSQVVDLLLQNGVKEARVYTGQDDILKAFSGSGIKLTITVFTLESIGSDQEAQDWVEKRISYFDAAGVWRINIANLGFNLGQNTTDLDKTFQPYNMLQNAINQAQYGDRIKLTIQYDTFSILKDNITKPSEAEIRDDIKQQLLKTIDVLQKNNAPFVIECFIIARIAARNWDIDFAFFDNKSSRVIKDVNGAVYTNYFEFEYDSVLWALEKIGAGNLTVVVGQVGWSTDGYYAANASMAERFYKGLLPYVASNKGTPKRPGVPIDVYVHALTDENKIPYKWPHMRHWGIYRTNGEPKFKIDLTGQGRDIFPSKLVGIKQMPDRWCVLDDENNDADNDKVKEQLAMACSQADCTSTWPGGSCGILDAKQNVSYAFNMYFQSMFQNESACDFDQLGKVVYENPSTGSCVFPVEVVEGEQDDFTNYLLKQAGGNRIRDNIPAGSSAILFVFWLFNLLRICNYV